MYVVGYKGSGQVNTEGVLNTRAENLGVLNTRAKNLGVLNARAKNVGVLNAREKFGEKFGHAREKFGGNEPRARKIWYIFARKKFFFFLVD